MEKLYTVNEVAEILRISADKVRILLNSGVLVGYKPQGVWYVKESDIEKYLGEPHTGRIINMPIIKRRGRPRKRYIG